MNVRCADWNGNSHLVNSRDLVKRVSAYGIYIKNSCVLLVQDSRSKRWELPGGGLENSEQTLEALEREFTEESGLQIVGSVEFVTKWAEHFYELNLKQGWDAHRSFFRVFKAAGRLLMSGNNDDVSAAKFIPLADLDKYPINQNITHVIRASLFVSGQKNSHK